MNNEHLLLLGIVKDIDKQVLAEPTNRRDLRALKLSHEQFRMFIATNTAQPSKCHGCNRTPTNQAFKILANRFYLGKFWHNRCRRLDVVSNLI